MPRLGKEGWEEPVEQEQEREAQGEGEAVREAANLRQPRLRPLGK